MGCCGSPEADLCKCSPEAGVLVYKIPAWRKLNHLPLPMIK